MSTATKTTFEVSNVHRATAPLPEVSYKEAVASQSSLRASRSGFRFGGSDRKQRSGAYPRQPPYARSNPAPDITGGSLPMSRTTRSSKPFILPSWATAPYPFRPTPSG